MRDRTAERCDRMELVTVLRAVGRGMLRLRRIWPDARVLEVRSKHNKIVIYVKAGGTVHKVLVRPDGNVRVYSRGKRSSILVKKCIERELAVERKKSVQEEA